MKTFMKVLAVVLALNEVRGIVNVVINGPRAVASAWVGDTQGLMDALSSMFFVVVFGVIIWAIAVTLRDYAPSIKRVIEENRS